MRKERKRLIIPFLLPAVILYVAFFIYPTVDALRMATFDWSGFTPTGTFIGLANFKELLSDDVYWSTLKFTVMLLLVGGIMVFGLAFLFTSVLSSGIRGKKFFRAVLFFP